MESIQAYGGPPPGGGGYGPPPGGGGYGPPPGAPPPGGGWGGPPGAGGPPPGGFGGPPMNPYGPPGYGPPPMGGGPMGPPPPDLQSSINTWFILSILSIFCCLIGGVIAIIQASGAKNAMAQGDYMTAQSKIGSAKTWVIVNIVVGVLATIANVAMRM